MWLSLFLAAGFCGGMSLAADAPQASALKDLPVQDSVSQYGITWKFDKKAPVGQFVTGDYYVVGPVTVVEVTPAPTGQGKTFRNGSMLNPPVTGYSAYDGRFANCFRQELTAKYPLELKPGDSLVSALSFEPGLTADKVPGNESYFMKAAAVLTCLKEAVPQDTFRPGYCDLSKDVLHRASEIHWELLPSVAPPSSAPPWSWAELERAFQRPWLDHVYSWESRDVHPSDNMPGYGREIASVVSVAALQLCTDASREQKTRLCQGMIQVGIDNWAIAKRGKSGEAGGWISQGGFGCGRKLPIVLAAILLQDQEMLHISKNAPETAFGEDQATEFGVTWTGADVRYTGQFPLSGQTDRGPYEQLWPGLWPGPDRTQSEGYRRASSISSSVGTALAAHLMKAEKIWDHDAFFAYMDRWMYEDDAEFVKMIKTALGVDYDKPWCLGMHVFPGDDKFTDGMWAQYRKSAGMAPVAEFRKTIDEQGQVKIGANREFIVNGKKLFPLMLRVQAKPRIQNAWALGTQLVEGKVPPELFSDADIQVQEALDLGANTVFVNGDAGESTWAFHYGREFLRRITDKGLYGVLGADTETFGQPNLLALTQEDQPDRPVTMLPTPPMPVDVNAAILNRPHRPHGAAAEAFNPASTEEGVLLETMQGAEVQITLAKPVTVSSLAVWIEPTPSREAAKEMVFLADGKEILTVGLKKESGKQEFKLASPVSFKELVFRITAVYPGEAGYGFVKQIGAFDENGRRVWLYDYEPEIRSVKKVADVYHWMRKMQKTRPVFVTLSPGFMPSSAMWDKETRQALYPGYIENCDAAGFVLPADPAAAAADWLNRVGEGVDELGRLAGPGRPVVFWLEVTPSLEPAQARAAIWSAIIHGATAIGYRMQQGDKPPVPDDKMAAALKQLNEQVAHLAPAILGEPARGKVQMTMNNAQPCRCKATESEGATFIFAQNAGADGKAVIRIEGLRAGTNIEVLGEGRTLASDRGEFSDDFASLADHVYKLKR
ncbi:MAG: hypothetical protein ABSA67_06045 [Candidatus Brocadiia bacterium]|jgi:hypothetical protein